VSRTSLSRGASGALALFFACAACSRAPQKPNVLVITIDTWRADRLSAAGFARPVTPEIDRLAAESLRFTHASAPRAKTTPSMASLFTGLYPHEHGARDLMVPLAPTVPLFAERLRAAGWSTAAIVGNFVLRDDFSGLARGFASWTEDLPDEQGVPPENVPQRTARSLTDGALVALGLSDRDPEAEAGPRGSVVREGEPWFLWLHYMDPHGVYAAPPEHRVFERAAPEWIPPEPPPAANGLNRRWIADYNVPAEARAADGRVDAARVRDHYDAEVHYADAEVGRLLDALRARGLLENTLVVVTSDHGESLGEQDYWFEHGRNVSEATVRVPLVVRWPASLASRPAPGVRGGDVSLCDVAPTILALLDLPPLAPRAGDGFVRGTSRLDAWRADVADEHPVFSEKVDRDEQQGAVQSKAVRIGDWKWIRRFAHAPAAAGERPKLVTLSDELYDLALDPREVMNLAAEPPDRAPVARLRAELLRFAAADTRFPELGAILREHRDALEAGDAETLRILKALGY
jgi:arylsulfatase A-like enzyme